MFFFLARKFRRLRVFFVLDCPCEEIGHQFYARKKLGRDRERKKKEGKEGKGRERKKNGRTEYMKLQEGGISRKEEY